ncbi:hypothetical protein CHH61_04260 [Shouchella clausii]|uniref:Uncharacterized protein n=1 Tax=Shouchella clausii TaxID=79880 RepID=A0A268S428_SHOCL|nr:hypothetical protein [Shouchella clausii]PAF27272.1 hypothetical protein CHH61_04260 [Shouchella clausii]
MTTHYIELNVHLKQSEISHNGLRVLADALPLLRTNAPAFIDEKSDMSAYQAIVESSAYRHVHKYESRTHITETDRPMHMDEDETAPHIELYTKNRGVNKDDMYLVVIPAVLKDKAELNDYMFNHLKTLLIALFGDNIKINSFEGTNETPIEDLVGTMNI